MTNSQFLYAYISKSQSYLYLKTAATPCHTPENVLPLSYHISCKNAQKTTCPQIHAIILYYYSMFLYGGVFTFSIMAVFSPGRGCIQLTRQLKNSTYPFLPKSLISYPIFHPPIKLCQFFTQFTKNTQNHFDTDFEKTLIFPSKTKLSDNLKI